MNYFFFEAPVYHSSPLGRCGVHEASKKERMISMMMEQSLFEFTYDYEPLTISYNMDISNVKEVINRALKLGRLTESFVQDILNWLKEKELEILERTYLPIRNRDLTFMGFSDAYRRLGHCRLYYYYPDDGDIWITKHLNVEDNADGIINVLAHEVLHGILPYRENHRQDFKYGMNVLNDRLSIDIRVRGLVGKMEKPTPKYELYCPCCHKVVGKFLRRCKKVNEPENFCCKKCRGPLELIIHE